MSVTVVGSVALDTVETPWGRNDEGLGGAATYFSLAASHYAPVHLVGVVGKDFPQAHIDLILGRDINLDGLETAEGRTFRWSGRYHEDVNERDTLDTQLNVFEQFQPKLTTAAQEGEYLFLANIHPALQLQVLEQAKASFIGLDTMNLWIDTTLDELKQVLRRVDVLIINDLEAKDLTGEKSLVKAARGISAMGPSNVVIKKGEHGCMLFKGEQVFVTPAFPVENVVDPTGAGDSFAGGFMGFIARKDATDFETLRHAVVYGTVTASYTCEAFGPDPLTRISITDIENRYQQFRKLTTF